MPGFVVRLFGPRPTFPGDMTPEEATVMAAHAEYWSGKMADGVVVAFGPVLDPAGVYGLGVLVADGLAAVEAFRDGDPAIAAGIGFAMEIAPMLRLVTPGGVHDAA